MSPSGRYPSTTTSIFGRMSELAAQHGAVNLGQGFPDFDGPAILRTAAAEAMAAGANQYTPSAGTLALRREIAATSELTRGLAYDPETEVTVTAGGSEAIAAACLAVLPSGAEVIALEPYYDYYSVYVGCAGARLVPVPVVDRGDRFAVDIDAIRRAVTPKTRVLLLNSPHNPTGMVLDEATLTALAELCIEANLTVISDEVYEHLTYDTRHRSIAALPGMRERTIIVSAASKTFSVTGWRIGWALAPQALTGPLRAAHMHMGFCAAAPLQAGVAAAFAWARATGYFSELNAMYRRKRDLVLAGLESAGFPPIAPQGAYFILARSERWTREEDALAFCTWLTVQAGVTALPLSSFYADPRRAAGYVRFAFCKREEVLEEAMGRLRAGWGALRDR